MTSITHLTPTKPFTDVTRRPVKTYPIRVNIMHEYAYSVDLPVPVIKAKKRTL